MTSRPYGLIDAYELPKDVEDWSLAPCCGGKPWVWRFDNGSYADCGCHGEKYKGQHKARSESIASCLSRTGKTAEYNGSNLKLAWEKWVATGELQDTLPEGQW